MVERGFDAGGQIAQMRRHDCIVCGRAVTALDRRAQRNQLRPSQRRQIGIRARILDQRPEHLNIRSLKIAAIDVDVHGLVVQFAVDAVAQISQHFRGRVSAVFDVLSVLGHAVDPPGVDQRPQQPALGAEHAIGDTIRRQAQ